MATELNLISGRETGLWGMFDSVSELPNVSGATIQDTRGFLEVGHHAMVRVASAPPVLYVCTTATAAAAVWKIASAVTGEAWVWPAYMPDGAALTALGTSINVDASTSLYYTDIGIPRRMTCTGVGLLMGTTITTDNTKVSLYDSAGALIIATASTDDTGLTADVFNQIAWTTAQLLEPGRYFVGVALDGTTDEIQVIDATHPVCICEKETGHVYATPADIASIATTFTADVAPIFYLY